MSDPTVGTVIRVYSEREDAFVVVNGVLDSGARQNWISRNLVLRLGARTESLVKSTDFEDFQGGTFTTHEHVKVTWHGNKNKQTRNGYFLVAEKGRFDILIGSDFLFSAGVFTFNESVLMNREIELTSEQEERQKQQKAEQSKKVSEYEEERKAYVEKEIKGDHKANKSQEQAQSNAGAQEGHSSS